MTVVVSTSSPLVSVALFDSQKLVASASAPGDNRASGCALFLLEKLLRENGRELGEARLFVADLGPGSFTGVKVGVMLAKAMAFAQRVPAAGVPSFDLVSTNDTVVVPSRKNEYFCRVPGSTPQIVADVPVQAVGYGAAFSEQRFPDASRARPPFQEVPPESLLPLYIAEPSISKPKDSRVLRGANA